MGRLEEKLPEDEREHGEQDRAHEGKLDPFAENREVEVSGQTPEAEALQRGHGAQQQKQNDEDD